MGLTDRLRERAEAWRAQNGEIAEVAAEQPGRRGPAELAATPDQPQSPRRPPIRPSEPEPSIPVGSDIDASSQPEVAIATTTTPEFDKAVPRGLQVAAAWSWRVLLVVAVIFGVGWLARYLSEVFVPVAIAILLAAMLSPVANRLRSWGLPRGAATAITVLGGMALIAGALTLIGTQIAGQASTLSTNVVEGFNQLLDYLRNGPIPISETWLNSDEWVTRIQAFLLRQPEHDRRVRRRDRHRRRPLPGRVRDRHLLPVLLPLRRPRHLHASCSTSFRAAPGRGSTRRRSRAGGRCRPTSGPPSWSRWSTPSAC